MQSDFTRRAHVGFTTTGPTTIDFRTPLDNLGDQITMYWSDNDGDSWNCFEDWLGWMVPRAGNYLINFPDKAYVPIFGSATETNENITNVEFFPEWEVSETMDFSGMFQNCVSLVSIPILPTVVSRPMFNRWDYTQTYVPGDMVLYGDDLYVANAGGFLSFPGRRHNNSWVKIDPNYDVEIELNPEPLSDTIKENTAGISKEDIPD